MTMKQGLFLTIVLVVILIVTSLIFGDLGSGLLTAARPPEPAPGVLLNVSLDASSPGRRLVNANTTNNVLTKLRFDASGDDVDVTRLALQLSDPRYNEPQDLVNVTLWDGNTQVGEAVFTSDNVIATIDGFVVPNNDSRVMVIKGNIAAIGVAEPAEPGHLIAVDYNANAGGPFNSTRGVALSSGMAVYATPTGGNNDTNSAGVRIFKSVPTVAFQPLPSNTYVNGVRSLYRFSVTTPSTGNVGLYKFSFMVATSGGATATSHRIHTFQMFGYADSNFSSDAYNNPLNSSTMGPAGASASGLVEIYFDPVLNDGTADRIQVPAGQTRYFQLMGTVTGKTATTTASIQLEGDAVYYKEGTVVPAARVDDGTSHDDFIWSGNSYTGATPNTEDWANGNLIPGLPATNLQPSVLTP